MYSYRQSNDNGLMTNLNSISSSLSSIDTIGRRTNTKASADNLITLRSHSIASTSLLWKPNKEPKHATRNGSKYHGSDIYHAGGKSITSYCLDPQAALNFLLVPLLLLTITRQVFDFLGQIWLQIIVNFFTIIIIIVALFGIRQHRISYLSLYSLWALFNTAWNLIVICIHSKIRDVGITEDVLSLHTGTTSWWHANGPGCLPYNISSIQPPVTILQPNIITGCRLDYHIIESSQAAVHSFFSLVTSFISCCAISNFRRKLAYHERNSPNDKSYKLNNISNDRSRVNQDPFPVHHGSRFNTNTASLRRAANKTSSRSSQHSVSSIRSARRRNKQSVDGAAPTPRGSTSSMYRSQKYGSISSRRSGKSKERRGEISSLTYGSTGDRRSSQRTRLSSLSSVDYLPSYQPPHSSSANLLSSYGEISSVDSYNNHNVLRASKNRQASVTSAVRGNTNPTYKGSRSSICSQNVNTNNYDDLSYIYGNNNATSSENHYGASSSGIADTSKQRQQIYQTNKSGPIGRRNGFWPGDQSQRIQAETYLPVSELGRSRNAGDTMTKLPDGGFQSFSIKQLAPSEKSLTNGKPQVPEINNNSIDQRNIANGNSVPTSPENRSRTMNGLTNKQQQIYTNQRNLRQPIYSNHGQDGNSETPI